MMDNRKRQLMQEALDAGLSPDQERELRVYLENDLKEAEHFSRLQQVDALLQTAPFERAPQRLALTILARVAEAVRQQQLAEVSKLSEAAVTVALQMVTVATLPLMVAASWMVIHTLASPELMEVVLYQVTALMILTIDIMKVLIDQARAAAETDPELALALLALIPVTLLALVRQVLGYDDPDADSDEPPQDTMRDQ